MKITRSVTLFGYFQRFFVKIFYCKSLYIYFWKNFLSLLFRVYANRLETVFFHSVRGRTVKNVIGPHETTFIATVINCSGNVLTLKFSSCFNELYFRRNRI
jgi:hypothetical protein